MSVCKSSTCSRNVGGRGINQLQVERSTKNSTNPRMKTPQTPYTPDNSGNDILNNLQ